MICFLGYCSSAVKDWTLLRIFMVLIVNVFLSQMCSIENINDSNFNK